jgi:hypothetical protein
MKRKILLIIIATQAGAYADQATENVSEAMQRDAAVAMEESIFGNLFANVRDLEPQTIIQ